MNILFPLFVGCFMLMMVSGQQRFHKANNPKICDPDVQQYSGYFQIDPLSKKKYFYWAFSSRSQPSTDPLILWMSGGPGCSSELAVLMENGPCKVNSNGTGSILNPYSWNRNANVIYIDQPAGTGFSTASESGYDFNETQVARDMYAFLQDFFAAHSEWQQNDFYIFAESYGGHYAPAVAHKVFEGNRDRLGIHINLKGVAIGNGLTNPLLQFPWYPIMAYNYSIAKLGKPVISYNSYESMMASIPQCQSYIKQCYQGNSYMCAQAQSFCAQGLELPYMQTGHNFYDIRKMCDHPPLCYDMSNIVKYLNHPKIQAELGVTPGSVWKACSSDVTRNFVSDYMRGYQNDIPDLLENNIRVLIYAGDCDFACNWLGNKAWTQALQWSGKNNFNAAQDKPYQVQNNHVGDIRSANGFTFFRIFDAGHMVPMDQPVVSLDMVQRFIRGQI